MIGLANLDSDRTICGLHALQVINTKSLGHDLQFWQLSSYDSMHIKEEFKLLLNDYEEATHDWEEG
jgi:hypothetical protein